jgi:hypothetical protein
MVSPFGGGIELLIEGAQLVQDSLGGIGFADEDIGTGLKRIFAGIELAAQGDDPDMPAARFQS